jgi:hypothetical protein
MERTNFKQLGKVRIIIFENIIAIILPVDLFSYICQAHTTAANLAAAGMLTPPRFCRRCRASADAAALLLTLCHN